VNSTIFTVTTNSDNQVKAGFGASLNQDITVVSVAPYRVSVSGRITFQIKMQGIKAVFCCKFIERLLGWHVFVLAAVWISAVPGKTYTTKKGVFIAEQAVEAHAVVDMRPFAANPVIGTVSTVCEQAYQQADRKNFTKRKSEDL